MLNSRRSNHLLFKAGLLILGVGCIMAFSFPTPQSTNADVFKYRKVNITSFTHGEKLEFRVHYGLINAANIVFEVTPTAVEKQERNCYNIKAEGKTLKSFDWAFKVRD